MSLIAGLLPNRGDLSRATPMASEECMDGDSGFCCQLCRAERESGLCTLFLARMVNTLLTGAALRSCTSPFLSVPPPFSFGSYHLWDSALIEFFEAANRFRNCTVAIFIEI